jgi:LacI family transcriptional regulator, galactose operon repressor
LRIESSREFGRSLLRGIAKYSRINGPWLFYSEPGGQEKNLPDLRSWRANGAIIRDTSKIDSRKIISLNLPTIVAVHIKEQVPKLPTIMTDSVLISNMAAEHLLDRGFRRFAYYAVDDTWWSQARAKAFGERIAESGFETSFYKQPRSRTHRSWQKEQIRIADWLESLPKPLGLMASCDDRAKHVIEACKLANLHIPEDVAVIGVDNDELVCDLSHPAISSVALDTERAGYEAAELLDNLMAGEKMANQKIIIRPTHIVTRQSTDILAIEDPDVVRAVRFIRQHAKEPIQVSDVARTVEISHRGLSQRFQKTLGHSINQQIRKARVEIIVRMLVETNLTVRRIAMTCGFTSVDHIARYFRKEKGMSLLDYRKKYGQK